MTNLYKSEEWKTLHTIDRAQLLLVIEGLKRGTIIGGNWTTFLSILKKTGLEYKLNTSKYRLNPVMLVAKPEILEEAIHRNLTLPQRLSGGEFHKMYGWLLEYPECCTEEYVKERTPEQIRFKKIGKPHLGHKFGQELTEKIKTDGYYPPIFDYLPPPFTPCGINCPEAIRILTSWKEAIDTLDPEAAKDLVYFNRRGLPAKLAHKQYLKQENKRRRLEYRIEQIRRSVE